MSRVGQQAIEFALTDTAGTIHRLSDYAGRWLLLVFHRHLAWLPCRDHLAQLREREAELESLGADVLVVTFESVSVARKYIVETNLPWPLVIDTDRSLYRAYGMESAHWRDLYGPRVVWLYLKLIVRGGRVRLPTGDTHQLGGDVIVDPQGIVRLHHVARGPAGRPAIESLLAVIRGR